MDEKIESFREQVLQWRGTRKKGAKPYTAEVKATALQLAKHLQSKGSAMDVVAKRLGIAAATLYCWRGATAPRKMVRVKVARAEPEASGPHVQLVSPRGYRIEGLPARLAIAMLQELV
jgi:transposase-like protein